MGVHHNEYFKILILKIKTFLFLMFLYKMMRDQFEIITLRLTIFLLYLHFHRLIQYDDEKPDLVKL